MIVETQVLPQFFDLLGCGRRLLSGKKPNRNISR